MRAPWRKPSTAERLESARSRQQDASFAGLAGPALNGVREARDTGANQESNRLWVWLAGMVAGGVILISLGMASFGHAVQPVWLVGGAAVFAWCGAGAWRELSGDRTTRRLMGAVGACVLLGIYAAGAFSQVVIDGKVYLASSKEARSVRLVREAWKDLEDLQVADELLAMEVSSARARFGEYTPQLNKMRAMSAKWARRDLRGLPDGRFLIVVQDLKVAANFAAEAMDRKRTLLTEDDARLQNELDQARATMIEASLETGAQLKMIAESLGVQLVQDGGE